MIQHKHWVCVGVFVPCVCVKEATLTLRYFRPELEAGGNGATGEGLEK